MSTTPTHKTAPDYGEPWKASANRIWDRMDFRVARAMHDEPTACRAVACVNACAGMADPAAELAELKRERDALAERLSVIQERTVELERERDEARAELAAMRPAMLAPIQLADACLGHLKQRDWFKEGVKDEVVCALNADLVRLTLAKLQPFTAAAE